jgi:ATP-dependent Clp protease ATP-binding subunit ClpC
VVLLDEIEKAHPDISNLLLQILDDGVLTDSLGNQVDFRNTLIIMTSNLGTRHLATKGLLGFRDQATATEQKGVEEMIMTELKREFSPEFINRVDDVIIFNPLERKELQQVAQLLFDDVNLALEHKGIRITVDESMVNWLLDKAAAESNSGARPLRRAVQRHIEDELSEFMIHYKEELPESVHFTLEGDKVVITPEQNPELADTSAT